MYQHGVRVGENATSITAPIQGTAGLQVIVGTAPINLVEKPEEAANKLVIAYSFEEAVKKLGYSDDWKNYTLCQSMYANFKVFNIAPIIMINVLDPATHKKSNADKEYTIVNGKVTLEEKDVLLSSIVVKDQAKETTYTKGTDYTTSFDEKGNVVIAIIAGGSISEAAISVSSESIDPTLVTANDIVGGLNSLTGKETGLELVRRVYPQLGLVPGQLLAPGWSQNPTVSAVMIAKTENINGLFKCETVIDIDTKAAKTYDVVKQQKEAQGLNSEHAIALWPKVKVGDKVFDYSTVYGALVAYTDANNGDVPNMSPSNKALRITGTVLEDGTDVYLDQQQGNLLNSQGIVTAINMNGWKAWGNNTSCYPSITDPKDRWIPVRRFFSWWGNSFIQTYFQKVDNPANYRLIESIVDSENIRCNSFAARGYIAGGRIEFNQEDNPITDILGGKIQFKQYIAPYTPAEDIYNVLEFDPTMIQRALFGEEA